MINNNMITMGDYAMVVTYWLLTMFWFAVLLSCVEKTFGLSKSPISAQLRPWIMGFLILSLIFTLDSLYWSITNTSRVGVIDKKIHYSLYSGWAVASIKLLFLIGAIVFWIISIKTFKKLSSITNSYYLSQVVDLTWDAVGILDPDGKVLVWNHGAERLYGFQSDEVVGKHIKDFLVPKERYDEIDMKLSTIRKELRAVNAYRTQRLKKDGHLLPVDITISPMLDERNTFKGYFGIMREIPCPILSTGGTFDPEQCLLSSQSDKSELSVFIGHGRNDQWSELKDHLHEQHHFHILSYEIGARTGRTINVILEQLLTLSRFAVLVLTAENIHVNGSYHARENVIHELGLFQGRLGCKSVIILSEEDVDDFSNISGIHQLRFQRGHIREAFGDIVAWLYEKGSKKK
jgi:PAS domain S-box-containing protein